MRRIEKNWPRLADTTHLGKRTKRIDGPQKVSGVAKYTFDINRPGMLYAKFTLCPYGHTKIRSIDVSEARKVPGVIVARAMLEDGQETFYAGYEVAVVAAETEEAAREAARRVNVDYEILPHNVDDRNRDLPSEWTEAGRSREEGDVEGGFAAADIVVEGTYGCPIITHCCLESHGSVIETKGSDQASAWLSTQRISSIVNDVADSLGMERNDVDAQCQHMGGGFGSKFNFDLWDEECARIAQETGRPVKAMLERDHEIMVAGSRPSGYADVRLGVKKDGTMTAWDLDSCGSGGPGRGRALRLPYIFTGVPTKRRHTSIKTNTGEDRAWRAPSHPQMCLITMSAAEDAAAALEMDPVDFFKKNLRFADRSDVYTEQIDIASRMMDWDDRWKPRGSATDPVRRGLGLSLHTWGGGGHDSNVRTTIHSDGQVEVDCGTQDLGVGTRTVLAVVTAETMGISPDQIRVNIGDSRLPPSGASGGSTTVGGISSASRLAAVDAINQIMERAAPELGADPDSLEARAGKIQVRGVAGKALSFADACALVGPEPVVGNGRTDRDLMNQGVGGVQMAEVEVDIETGVVRMVKMVAVQDCGLVVDLTTAESQVYGGCIMGITSALFEERVMDPVTGTCLNPDMEFYRLAGIGDVGEIEVHMMQDEKNHSRGVIGLGEPPVISPMAAVANAVANAAGVRVSTAPFTPAAVLQALGKGGSR